MGLAWRVPAVMNFPRALVFCLLVCLAGCASLAPPKPVRPGYGTLELSHVPFYPQQGNWCGPTTLAEVLVASGVDVTPEQLAPQLYIPEREGSLQIELIAQTRKQARVPYVLEPTWDAVERELQGGNPALVMLNLGLAWAPVWHYAVVIGFDYAQQNVILRSGQTDRLMLPLARFERAWERAQHWAMVVVRPEHTPVSASSQRWLEAAYAMEQVGQNSVAEQAYVSGSQRWPDTAAFAVALGNRYYAVGDFSAAEMVLRQQLTRGRDGTVLNNLAQIAMDRGDLKQAEQYALQAVEIGGPHRKLFVETLKAIRLAK